MTSVYWVAAMLALVSLIYGGAALAYYFSLRPGMAVAFMGYVIANAGLIWDVFHSAPK